MSQTRTQSLFETLANTFIGFIISLISQLIIFHMFDIHLPLDTNIWISVWFTVISLIRGYLVRRWFNSMIKKITQFINERTNMTTANTTKPTFATFATFAISIHDGFCEWTYMLPISEELSISAIATKICDTFDVQKPEPLNRSDIDDLAVLLTNDCSYKKQLHTVATLMCDEPIANNIVEHANKFGANLVWCNTNGLIVVQTIESNVLEQKMFFSIARRLYKV